MAESFFRDLDIPAPDVSLEIAGGSSNEQTARVMLALEPLFLDSRPDLVLVVGDVNATVAAAMVAARLRIPLAHVEAGLRSFDRSMPEEINRIVTDTVSDYLFTSEAGAGDNLRREGIAEEKIFFCGNVMIDTLLRFRDRAGESDVLARFGLEPGRYVLVTLHRPSNVDDPQQLADLLSILDQIATHMPVVFPVHPRTANRMTEHQLRTEHVRVVPPLGYIDFVRMMADARLVMTDSGGIQEETTVLGVACLTVRDNTERPVTVSEGTNCLVGTDPEKVLKVGLQALQTSQAAARRPALWDGRAAARIADILERVLP
jgi:UDP-N-acetylglucosamine 2-epimerase (non-hydrolysing)